MTSRVTITITAILSIVSSLEFYTNTPSVMELTDQTFDATLTGDTAFFVEFYMDTCGHCRAFKPYYEKFAQSVFGWKDVVTVGAVNCPNNPVTCGNQHIAGVPSIKYFSPRSRGLNGKAVSVRKSAEGLREELLDLMIADRGLSSVINFTRSGVDDPRLFAPLSAIIVDAQPNDTLGAQLLLDLYQYRGITAVRALPDSPNVAGSVREAPSVMLARGGDIVYRTSLRSLLRDVVLQFAGAPATTTEVPLTEAPTLPPSYNTQLAREFSRESH